MSLSVKTQVVLDSGGTMYGNGPGKISQFELMMVGKNDPTWYLKNIRVGGSKNGLLIV